MKAIKFAIGITIVCIILHFVIAQYYTAIAWCVTLVYQILLFKYIRLNKNILELNKQLLESQSKQQQNDSTRH